MLMVDKILWWSEYLEAKKKMRKDILTAKRLSWRDYCNSLDADFNKAVSTIKNQKRNRDRTGTFTHPEGPAAATSAMVDHIQQVYNGHLLHYHVLLFLLLAKMNCHTKLQSPHLTRVYSIPNALKSIYGDFLVERLQVLTIYAQRCLYRLHHNLQLFCQLFSKFAVFGLTPHCNGDKHKCFQSSRKVTQL